MRRLYLAAIVATSSLLGSSASLADPAGPSVVDPNLMVRTVVRGRARASD
jgi:hypothetical protein